MNIIITGQIGCGKTTVCKSLLLKLKDESFKCGGIISFKSPKGNIEVYSLTSQKKKTLALLDINVDNSNPDILEGLKTSKYYFCNEGIKFGNEAILNSLKTDVIFVDEIGQIELCGKGFIEALNLIESGLAKSMVIVIREDLLEKYLKKINFKKADLNFYIYNVNIKNRDELPDIILQKILNKN